MGYATNQLAAIPFGQIIGGPLKAAVEAQGMAAMSAVNFIQAVGFEPSTTTEGSNVDTGASTTFGKVRNIVFKYQKTDAEGIKRDITLEVPILTILPIPFIRIDTMTIDFTANMSESSESSSKSESASKYSNQYSSAGGWGWWWHSHRYNFSSQYSSSHNSSSQSQSRYKTEYAMNVNVRAVQDDIPAGLSKVLNILESSIKSVNDEKPTTTATSSRRPGAAQSE